MKTRSESLRLAGWHEIETEDTWNHLDESIKGGEDGLLKDFHLSHQTYVNKDLNMVFEGLASVWLLLQLQNEPVSSVEFLITEVQSFQIDLNHDLSVTLRFLDDAVTLSLSYTGTSRITGRQIYYRIPTPSLLGNGQFANVE